ncbi:hypothetical protein [Tabrizicola fusiformis]|nr:hypothetical protein [Tabrizicola sp. SY72]
MRDLPRGWGGDADLEAAVTPDEISIVMAGFQTTIEAVFNLA